MTKYYWNCGLPTFDEDGEFECFDEFYDGTIETDETDPAIIESLCADDFRLQAYGDKDHSSDPECELMLDNLVYEKEEA